MSKGRTNIFDPGNVLLNKWVILELIGRGAMGEIYLAHQLSLKRDVAIKVVSAELLRDFVDDPDEIETAFQRFKREVHAMARVRHPNVLQIFDYGSTVIQRETGDCSVEFIAMEYIPGDTLRFTMSEEGFYPEQDLTRHWLEEYFLPVLDGMEAIHDLDIVHRDIKPENILMDGKIPKIADFGLARSPRLKPVTQSMDVKGTAHYMSPEHFFDFRKADQRADILRPSPANSGKEQYPLKPSAFRRPKPHFSRNWIGSSRMLRLRTEKIDWGRQLNCERPF